MDVPSVVELLQRLIRFDTTNPPGDVGACLQYVRDLLARSGLEPELLARFSQHPNLVARLPGRGAAPPLLLYGHVDVVTADNQVWSHPPFEGAISGGYLWGRGALDMKGAVAVMLVALLRARAEGLEPPGDVVLALLCDEETGGDQGAAYLVDAHPERFAGIRYAIGEAGGFTFHLAGRRLYPIMVAEKQICWLRVVLRGRGGHGSMPVRGGAMAALARLLERLDRRRLPVHITPAARQMVEAIAGALPGPKGRVLRLLLHPRLTDGLLRLLGPTGEVLDPILRNTVSPTVVQASDKINVIPSQVVLQLDGRLLPGYEPATLLSELRSLSGEDLEIEVVRHDPGPPAPDMGLFDTLAGILREGDPEAAPHPFLMAGVTDARHFSRLGIQTYGFTPMLLPPGFEYWKLAHGADERVPLDGLEFGVEATYKLLSRFGAGP